MPIDSSTDSSTNEYTTLPRHVMDFLKSIDTDETILVVTDFGKGNFSHRVLFSELSDFLLTETHHMKVRVGGNSYRFASRLIFNLLDRKMTNCRRFEFFRTGVEENADSDDNWIQRICEVATVRFMRDYKFDIASDFIRYVDKYDIRGSGAGMNYEAKTVTVYDYGKSMMGAESVVVVPSMMSDDEPDGPLKDGTNVQRINPELGLRGSMAVLWVRNEQSGFLHDGEFSRFNDSDKGAWAIADVMMVKGYEDVLPATHALYGDATSNLAPNQRRLFKDAGLVCHHLIRSYEEVDEERRECLKLRESIREKTENGESMGDELLTTE